MILLCYRLYCWMHVPTVYKAYLNVNRSHIVSEYIYYSLLLRNLPTNNSGHSDACRKYSNSYSISWRHTQIRESLLQKTYIFQRRVCNIKKSNVAQDLLGGYLKLMIYEHTNEVEGCGKNIFDEMNNIQYLYG